jgi:hypothetical protein
VLDADVLAQQRVEGVGDVAGGIDVRVGGAQLRVNLDAVIDLAAGRRGQPGGQGDANPDGCGSLVGTG